MQNGVELRQVSLFQVSHDVFSSGYVADAEAEIGIAVDDVIEGEATNASPIFSNNRKRKYFQSVGKQGKNRTCPRKLPSCVRKETMGGRRHFDTSTAFEERALHWHQTQMWQISPRSKKSFSSAQQIPSECRTGYVPCAAPAAGARERAVGLDEPTPFHFHRVSDNDDNDRTQEYRPRGAFRKSHSKMPSLSNIQLAPRLEDGLHTMKQSSCCCDSNTQCRACASSLSSLLECMTATYGLDAE